MKGPGTRPAVEHSVHQCAVASCTLCACLCHDVRFDATAPEFFGCRRAQSHSLRIGTEDSRSVFTEKDVEQAASLLADAVRYNRAVALAGLEWLSSEAQKAAIALAETVGAWVVRSSEIDQGRSPWAAALAQKGCVSASWSEIRLRSDAMLLWYAPLWRSHPRWVPRFGPRSERAHRLAIVAPGDAAPESGWMPEQIVRVEPARACEFLRAIWAAIGDDAIEPEDSDVRKVVHMIRNARWLTVVRSADPPGLTEPYGVAETFADLVAASNHEGRRRVVATYVPDAINDSGLDALLSMRAGLSTPLRFTPDGPSGESGEWSADDIDVYMTFNESSPVPYMVSTVEFHSCHRESREQVESLRGKKPQRINVPIPEYGSASSGTLIRGDGVPVPVRGFGGGSVVDLSDFLHAVRKSVLSRLAEAKGSDEPVLRVLGPEPGAVG